MEALTLCLLLWSPVSPSPSPSRTFPSTPLLAGLPECVPVCVQETGPDIICPGRLGPKAGLRGGDMEVAWEKLEARSTTSRDICDHARAAYSKSRPQLRPAFGHDGLAPVCFARDDVAARYTAIADDASSGERRREAGMLFSAAR